MLQILRSHETPAGDLVLREMFAARKSVFVDLLKWSVPVVDGAYERDQYDDEAIERSDESVPSGHLSFTSATTSIRLERVMNQ